MTWYQEWFGEDYLKVYPHRDEQEARLQVDFLMQHVPLQSGQRVLDLGCGSGRHAVELAGRGLKVVCLDLSLTLLKLARKRALAGNVPFPMLRSDMRRLPLRRRFDAVMSFFTSFGYFDADEENFEVIQSVADVLKPGGWFLLDYLNEQWTLSHLVPRDERRDNGLLVVQERHFDPVRHRLEKKILLEEGDDVREYFESVRVYSHEEMLDMLSRARLKLRKIFGDWDGTPYDRDTPRMILISQKEGAN
jgi:SAM-dependent methyltransferase